MKIVALEEHSATFEIMDARKSVDPARLDLALKATTEGEGARRLLDLGAERLDTMNEAGIYFAVLSLTTTLNDKRVFRNMVPPSTDVLEDTRENAVGTILTPESED
jgi:hypothetical protein